MAEPKKSLIFLFDGTNNTAAGGRTRDATNVFKLNMAIQNRDENGRPQLIFYYPGPGTRGALDQQVGAIFAEGLDEIIREAYINLSSNYEDGDRLYLFGYSRGAVVARALTGMLSASGLLYRDCLDHLWAAWAYFLAEPGRKDPAELTDELCNEELKRDYLDGVAWPNAPTVNFLGAFDSVFGRPYNKASGHDTWGRLQPVGHRAGAP